MAELVQFGSHNLCLFLDNISHLADCSSDALARFSTGDGFIKRALYTNDDDALFTPQGVVAINGINLVATAPDLLDRSLIFKLGRPADSERRLEVEIMGEFEALRPKLLGAIFTALSYAMGHLDTAKLPSPSDSRSCFGIYTCLCHRTPC